MPTTCRSETEFGVDSTSRRNRSGRHGKGHGRDVEGKEIYRIEIGNSGFDLGLVGRTRYI